MPNLQHLHPPHLALPSRPSTDTVSAPLSVIPIKPHVSAPHPHRLFSANVTTKNQHLCTGGAQRGLAGGGEREMMGLAKISPDGWRYYAAEIAGGAEDYFVSLGEESGRWMGAGANTLGLSGMVDEEGLGRLFGEGRHPVTGAGLGRPFASVCDRERASAGCRWPVMLSRSRRRSRCRSYGH
jgi:hypothetical protein